MPLSRVLFALAVLAAISGSMVAYSTLTADTAAAYYFGNEPWSPAL